MKPAPSTSGTTTAGSGPDLLWTHARVRALGAVTDLRTAAAIFGLGRNSAYELVHKGQFPVPVIRAGSRYRVPVAPILTILGLAAAPDDHPGEAT